MFTGLVEELATVREREGGRLVIDAPRVAGDAGIGHSIAINGCCLTVTAHGVGWFEVHAVPETLSRTNLASLQTGDRVNLERPLRPTDRMGGHIVQGHVDAVGEVIDPAPELRVTMPADLLRYVVEKGSIAIDGISLTVVKVMDDGFTVAVIPHTTEVTTLGIRQPGDTVNLEVDVMAKYAERLLEHRTGEQ